MCGLFFNGKAYAKVSAALNQDAFFQGDPISLVIETDKQKSGDPDLSPLLKDFEIKGTSTSARTNFINGSRSFKKIWKIKLHAKKSGELTIPAISLGKEKTKAITFNVNELPPEVAAETSKHIFIESKVDIKNDEIYVQQQIK